MEAGKKRLAGDTARAANTDEVKELCREAKDLKEVVAEQTLELRLLKKSMTGPSRQVAVQSPARQWMGRPRMRYAASEKLEIIRLVEESHLSARLTLAKLGIPRTTFYRWYDRYLQRGEAGLQDQSPKPKHVWNRVPDEVRRKVVDFALQETELSPRELAVTFTDQERYFVSESTVYRTLKAHGLDHQPGLHRHQGCQWAQRQDDWDQPALANRLHLYQSSGLGLVLSQHDSRRLQPLHRLMETLLPLPDRVLRSNIPKGEHAGSGRYRYTGPRITGVRL